MVVAEAKIPFFRIWLRNTNGEFNICVRIENKVLYLAM